MPPKIKPQPKRPALQAVPLLAVYTKDGETYATITPDTDRWKLYGFLKIYMKHLQLELFNDMERKEGEA